MIQHVRRQIISRQNILVIVLQINYEYYQTSRFIESSELGHNPLGFIFVCHILVFFLEGQVQFLTHLHILCLYSNM
jgi:hypothetical protein